MHLGYGHLDSGQRTYLSTLAATQQAAIMATAQTTQAIALLLTLPYSTQDHDMQDFRSRLNTPADSPVVGHMISA